MNPVFMAYALLALAIISEVTGSTFFWLNLKVSLS